MIENEQIESNAEPQLETSSTGDRDSLGRKKRRWGFNREQRAALRKTAAEAQSTVTDEYRLRMKWKENFEALDPAAQADLRQRESHVLYLAGSMMLFLREFEKEPNGLLPDVSEPCFTFCEVEEYLQKWPLLQVYLPDCRSFSLIGIDLESQRVRSLIPCDGYRLYGMRTSLGGGSWPDVLDGNGRSLYYRFMCGLDDYCKKHRGDVDSAVAQKAKEFVDSRIKPSASRPTARPVTAPPASPTAAIPGWVEPVSSKVEREMQLNDKIRSDVRESIKKFQDDLQENL